MTPEAAELPPLLPLLLVPFVRREDAADDAAAVVVAIVSIDGLTATAAPGGEDRPLIWLPDSMFTHRLPLGSFRVAAATTTDFVSNIPLV